MVAWLIHSSWQDKTINLQENKRKADQAEDDAGWENIFGSVWKYYFPARTTFLFQKKIGQKWVPQNPNNQPGAASLFIALSCPSYLSQFYCSYPPNFLLLAFTLLDS